MNRDEEFAKLFKMIDLMAEYSKLKPGQIEKVCKEKPVSFKYYNFTTLLVESFFSIYSFSLLVKEALFSNASGVLRTLIEQVTAAYVLAKNEKALETYLEIKELVSKYENHEISIEDINKKYDLKLSKKNVELFFDYGWSLSFGNHSWGRDKIIKESGLEEVLQDFWYLNKFTHGQLSWYQLLNSNSKDVLDRHIARTIMICGKIFNYLCYAAVKFLGEKVESNESYQMFVKIKALYLNINTYAVRRMVVEQFKNKEDIRPLMEQYIRSTKSSLSMLLEHEFDDLTKNLLAVTCYRQMETILVMFAYMHSPDKEHLFNNIDLHDVLDRNVCPLLFDMYPSINSKIAVADFKNMISIMNDKWGPFRDNNFASNIDEEFFMTVVHLFDMIY